MRIKTLRSAGLGLLTLAWAPAWAEAQTIQDRITVLEEKINLQHKQINDALGIDIHALVDTTYNYSINAPKGDIPLRVYNFNQNSFDLRDVVLSFSRQREDEMFGFVTTIDFGRTAVLGNGTDWGFDNDSVVDVREAYATVNLPLELPGGKINAQVGKFVTLLGWEVLLDPRTQSYNNNITLSMLSGFSIPFTHTGGLVNFPIHDMVEATLGVVNGWDNVKDNNSGKSLLWGLGVNPMDKLSLYFAGTYGAEDDPLDDGGAGAGSKTAIVTGNAALNLHQYAQLVLDSTWASVNDASGPGTSSALWYGFGGYWIADWTDRFQTAFRAEVFDDADGYKLGFDEAPTGQTIWGTTLTLSYWLVKNHLLLRGEYRHDESNRKVFATRDTDLFWRGQDTLSTELILAF
jgi:hypothetical protein